MSHHDLAVCLYIDNSHESKQKMSHTKYICIKLLKIYTIGVKLTRLVICLHYYNWLLLVFCWW